MAIKHRPDDGAMSEINVTPLVDVMLVLVIILLVTAPLLTQSVHVTLPKTSKVAANLENQPLQLALNSQGGMTLNNQAVDNLLALEALLKAEFAKNQDVGVHLYADQDVVYKKVAEAMAVVQKVGIAKIAFVTVEE